MFVGRSAGLARGWPIHRAWYALRRGPPNTGPPTHAPVSAPVNGVSAAQKHSLVKSLWRAAHASDETPGRAYLASRFAWSPCGIGPALPGSVRWLEAANAPGRNPEAKWYGLPHGAAGCLVFVYRCVETGVGMGLALLAVSEAVERVLWFDRVKMLEVGQRKGAVFTAREAANADAPVLACEGEINALALCLSPWAEPGARVVSVGPASNMDAAAGLGRNVVLFVDDDWPGRKAGLKAAKAIRRFGHNADIQFCAGDPNDELAELVGERAAIRECSGGASRADADKGAWIDLLTMSGLAVRREAHGQSLNPLPNQEAEGCESVYPERDKRGFRFSQELEES